MKLEGLGVRACTLSVRSASVALRESFASVEAVYDQPTTAYLVQARVSEYLLEP